MSTSITLVDCDFERHGMRMLEIVNEAIANTTWVYDYEPRSPAQLQTYIAERRAAGFPVIGAIDDGQSLLGYGSFGPYRSPRAYKYTVEHSVFVDKAARRKGIGAQLLRRLIEIARAGDVHVMLGAIDSSNAPSIALHEAFGFQMCGRLRDVGYKHGRWLDALFYELVLETPSHPREP